MKLTHRRAVAVAVIVLTLSAWLRADARAGGEAHPLGAAAKGYAPAAGSLVEGLDGALYLGAGKDGAGARLVEFDPHTGDARVAVDVHELLSLHGPAAQGYAAQARIATRNCVGPSGRVYVGTTHGEATEEEKKANARFGGGYVIAYDPRTGLGEHFDMPMPRHGVADVIADEGRELIYAVTDATDERDGAGAHWVLYDKNSPNRGEYGMPGKYRELGPRLAPGTVTLIDARGVASVLTSDWRIAQYEPEQDRLSIRGITIGEQPLAAPAAEGDKTVASLSWSLGQDGRTAYAVRSDDGTVYAIDLLAPRGTFEAKAPG